MTDSSIRSEKAKDNDSNLAAGARGGAIAFILKITSTVLGFANQVILAQILGAGGVGEVIMAVTLVRISAQIAKFGMEDTMMKFIPIYIDRNDRSRLLGTASFALKFCAIFSTVFMLLVLVSSKFIAINIFHSENLLKLLPVVVIAIPAWVIRDVIGGILRGYKDALSALIPESLISPFFRIAVFLILIIQGVSTMYAIIAFVTGEILAVITSIVFLRKKLKEMSGVKKECDTRKVFEVAYSIIFTSMGAMLYTQADIWILGMFTSMETVGVYGVAAKLVLLVYFPMMAFVAIIPSMISSIYASGDHDELKRIVRETTRWTLSIALPIILVLVLEGELILGRLYGSEFAAGYAALLVLTIAHMIKACVGLVGTILQMTGGHKFFMKVNIVGGLLNIVLNIFLVPRFGMVGAAVSTAACIVMIDVICVFVVYKRLSVFTLARGIEFDIVFIALVAGAYFLSSYSGLYLGNHIVLGVSLALYLWKTLARHDVPWRLLTAKDKGG